MKHIAVLIIFAANLTGCYMLNQEKFEAYASKKVSAGMSLSSASENLNADGFMCDSKSFRQFTSCTRTFNNLPTIQTCMERINLYQDSDRTNVERVEIGRVTCVGF